MVDAVGIKVLCGLTAFINILAGIYSLLQFMSEDALFYPWIDRITYLVGFSLVVLTAFMGLMTGAFANPPETDAFKVLCIISIFLFAWLIIRFFVARKVGGLWDKLEKDKKTKEYGVYTTEKYEYYAFRRYIGFLFFALLFTIITLAVIETSP